MGLQEIDSIKGGTWLAFAPHLQSRVSYTDVPSLCSFVGQNQQVLVQDDQMHPRVKKREPRILYLNSPLEGTGACHYLGAILLLLLLLLLLQCPSCLAF